MAAPPQAGPTRAPGGQAAGAHRAATPIVTLKKRPEFLAVRKGARWACRFFVVEALKRAAPATAAPSSFDGPRFGFTVSKQNGKAVDRNRIKRRLRAAASQLQVSCARPMFDYVVIARPSALDAPFEALMLDLATALERVSQERRPDQRRHQRKPARSAPPTKSPSS